MTIRTALLDASYDFWLDFHGTPGKARRQLRSELKANLAESVAAQGWDRARAGLGDIRLLAKEGAEAVRDPRRPAWNSVSVAAGIAFIVIVLSALFASAAFTDGAMAAGLDAGQGVVDSITLMPGVRASAEDRSSGFIVGLSISPWLMLGVPAVVFLLAARVWRLAGRRSVA